MYVAQPIEWTDHGVVMLDQRLLPAEEVSHTYTNYREVAEAIRDMVIRGAPAIGVAAAMGAALGVLHSSKFCRNVAHGIYGNLRYASENSPHRG
jgi:methylthioribose-1-phosphate isomerase